VRRRQLLALAGALPLAGCLGGTDGDAVVRAQPSSAFDTSTPVVFDDLPAEERAIVRTAVDDGFYHACPELPGAVRSFAGRLDSEAPSLEYDGDRYGLYVRVEDLVYADTADPPERMPGCGPF
jgi:hypothetical protein